MSEVSISSVCPWKKVSAPRPSRTASKVRGGDELQGRVLCPGDLYLPVQPGSAFDEKTFHLCPSLMHPLSFQSVCRVLCRTKVTKRLHPGNVSVTVASVAAREISLPLRTSVPPAPGSHRCVRGVRSPPAPLPGPRPTTPRVPSPPPRLVSLV